MKVHTEAPMHFAAMFAIYYSESSAPNFEPVPPEADGDGIYVFAAPDKAAALAAVRTHLRVLNLVPDGYDVVFQVLPLVYPTPARSRVVDIRVDA